MKFTPIQLTIFMQFLWDHIERDDFEVLSEDDETKFNEIIQMIQLHGEDRSIPNSERRKGEYSEEGTLHCDNDLRSMRKNHF